MSRIITEPEAAFLAMMARRTLRFQREAEQRDQTYNDLTKPWELACGHRARIVPVAVAHGYEPEVEVLLKDGTDPAVAEQIARDILGGPAVALDSVGKTLKFRRKP